MTMAPEVWGSTRGVDDLPATPKDERETSLAAWTHTTRLEEDTVDGGSMSSVLRSID